MGLSVSIYVGAWAECRPHAVPTTQQVYACPADPMHEIGVAPYCPWCGAKLEPIERADTVTMPVDGDVAYLLKEALTTIGRDDDDGPVVRWAPNVGRPGCHQGEHFIHADGADGLELELDAAWLDAAKAALATAFAEELATLARAYTPPGEPPAGLPPIKAGIIVWED